MSVIKTVKDFCEEFERLTADPTREIRRLKSGKAPRIIGFLPTDVPEELLHAAGAHPFGIVTYDGAQVNRADSHLQTWACSLARCTLGMALAGSLDHLNGLIIPLICDTTRMMSGIWKQVKPFIFMENFLLPRQVDRPSAKQYLIGELGRLKARLEQFMDRPVTAEDLKKSNAAYNHNRRLLRKLYELHVRRPDLVGNRAVYSAIKSSMFTSREIHSEMLSGLIAAVEREAPGKKSAGAAHRVRVMLSGKLGEPPAFMDILDESGAVCVADDLCTGYRYIATDVAEEGDPLEALAGRQLRRLPLACFVSNKLDRPEFLVNRAKEARAAGVIFLHLKFCEPENYDYPSLRGALFAAGIPNLRVETEVGNVSRGQISTRVQAFMEMLGGGEIYGR